MHPILIANGYLDFLNGYNVNPAPIYLELNMSKYILQDGKYWEVDYYYIADKEALLDDVAFLVNLLYGSAPFSAMSNFIESVLEQLEWNRESFYTPLLAKIKEKYEIQLKTVDKQ